MVAGLILICFIFYEVQLLLCKKVKFIVLKLIPVILVLIALATTIITMRESTGWEAMSCFMNVCFLVLFLISCIIGWIVWAVSNSIKKKKGLVTPT